MCVEQKHNELEREYGVINGIRSLYMILRRVVFPGARSGETGKNYGIFGWPFHDFPVFDSPLSYFHCSWYALMSMGRCAFDLLIFFYLAFFLILFIILLYA